MQKNMEKLKKKSTQAEHHLVMRIKESGLDFRFIDRVIIFSGPLIPLAVSFQVYEVWLGAGPQGLSIVTWLLLAFSSLTMAIYAMYHRAVPLMLTYIPLVIANSLVVLGIVLL